MVAVQQLLVQTPQLEWVVALGQLASLLPE